MESGPLFLRPDRARQTRSVSSSSRICLSPFTTNAGSQIDPDILKIGIFRTAGDVTIVQVAGTAFDEDLNR